MKIALFGVFPLPIGGISIHLQRLSNKLDDNNIQCKKYDIIPNNKKKTDNYEPIYNLKKWLLKNWNKIDEDIIHFHTCNEWHIILALSIIAHLKKKKIIVTLHSFRDDVNKFNIIKKIIFKLCIKMVDEFIAVSKTEYDKLVQNNCKKEKVNIIPGYINPTVNNRNNYFEEIDIPNEFFNNYEFIISWNASHVSFYDGVDLYGLDIMIDLLIRVSEKYKNLGMILCITQIDNIKHYNDLQSRIINSRLKDRIIIITKPVNFIDILKKSNLFIRPTYSDGDAISVREALSLKIPTIASDAAKRPEGTIIFQNRDIDDLLNRVCDVVDNYEEYCRRLQNVKIEDNFSIILNCYERLYN